MKRALFALAVLLTAGPWSASLAQTPPNVIDDPEATIVSELVVRAPTPGPVWWRVSNGDSIVWILGLPDSSAPKGLKWDRSVLERRLTGAQALLTPPTVYLAFPAAKKISAADAGSSAGTVTPALAERFSLARTRIKKPHQRYASYAPATAFLMLYRDYLQAAKLEHGEAHRWARAMARARRVPIVQPTTIPAGSLTLAQMDPARPEAAACYGALLDAVEAPAARYRIAAESWARGDLASATSAPRHPFGICENRLFNQGAGRRSIEGQVAAIKTALNKPGKTVAVANLRSLLAQDGILNRLKRDGYEVTSPLDTGGLN